MIHEGIKYNKKIIVFKNALEETTVPSERKETRIFREYNKVTRKMSIQRKWEFWS